MECRGASQDGVVTAKKVSSPKGRYSLGKSPEYARKIQAAGMEGVRTFRHTELGFKKIRLRKSMVDCRSFKSEMVVQIHPKAPWD